MCNEVIKFQHTENLGRFACILGDRKIKIFTGIDHLYINLFAFWSLCLGNFGFWLLCFSHCILLTVFGSLYFGPCISVASQITRSSMELFFLNHAESAKQALHNQFHMQRVSECRCLFLLQCVRDNRQQTLTMLCNGNWTRSSQVWKTGVWYVQLHSGMFTLMTAVVVCGCVQCTLLVSDG